MKSQKGVTFIELLVTIVIAGILASSFVALMVPQINLFFFLPQRLRINNAASDLMDTLLDGNNAAQGLRYAGPLAAGASAITAASTTSLTYTYVDDDFVNHTVVLSYSAGTHEVTRQVDAGAAQNVPTYATSASGILLDPVPAEVNFFRYYNSAGTEFTPAPATLSNIYRVDIAAKTSSGSGKVRESEGNMILKSAAEIKHYTT